MVTSRRGCTLSVGLLLGCISAAGCNQGGNDLPRGVVTGRVNLDGVPVKQCVLVFQNADKSVSVSAQVQDGTYLAKAYQGGIPVGQYKIGVVGVYQATAYTFGPSEGDPSHQPPEEATFVVDIPKQYADPDQSPLVMEVREGDNRIDFELVSR